MHSLQCNKSGSKQEIGKHDHCEILNILKLGAVIVNIQPMILIDARFGHKGLYTSDGLFVCNHIVFSHLVAMTNSLILSPLVHTPA
jgi:hypothetical protein